MSELLPRPEGRGFPAASSFLRRHSPLTSGRVLREFSVSASSAQTYIRFAMQRFRSHRTGSGCSLPTIVARISPCNPPHSSQPLTNNGTRVMRTRSPSSAFSLLIGRPEVRELPAAPSTLPRVKGRRSCTRPSFSYPPKAQ